MIEYIYFVKCPNCEDEQFAFFDDAKSCAMNCLTKKPIITQTEVCRNDFGECTDSADLGTIWSWEDMMKDVPEDSELTTFSKAETIDCEDDYFNCEFDELDNSLDSVPDNFRRPSTSIVKEDFEFVDNWEYLDYGAKLTKEELYNLLVTQGRCVEIGIGDQEHYDARFSDGSRYSDSRLNITMNADGSFDAYEWDHSDDGDSTDGEFEFTSKSFDEFWDELVDYAPEYFIDGAGLAEGVHDSTRALRDSDFVIVSKHNNPKYYSFLGKNFRMTKQLDKAMPYASKAEAEYDIPYAEDQQSSDRYVNADQVFVVTTAEARKLLNDESWRKAKQISFDDLTVEQLVEKMEENEDTVECKVCEELFEKTKCHKDAKLGWVCEGCSSNQQLSESADTTTWVCYFDGKELGTVQAADEEEAYGRMEQTWPTYNYSEYDGVAVVEPLNETLTEASADHVILGNNKDAGWVDGDVVLEYDDLWVEYGYGGMVDNDWYSPPEPKYWFSGNVSHTYYVSPEDVAVVLFENYMTEEDVKDVPGGLEALSEDDALWSDYLDKHFDGLVEKYQQQLLDYYEEDAAEDYENKKAEEDDEY